MGREGDGRRVKAYSAVLNMYILYIHVFEKGRMRERRENECLCEREGVRER
jgi:hypothetical protein